MTTPIVEPPLGQPGWNLAFRQVLDRINALPETITDTVAAALIAGTGMSISYNDAAGTITLNAAGGGGALDTEALMDYLAAHIIPDTNMSMVYDDEASQIILSSMATDGGVADGSLSPGLHNFLAWTLDPATAGTTSTLNAGDLWLAKINIPVSATIGSATLAVGSAGATLTNCFVGLFDMTGTRLALSANQATSWQSNGSKDVPFTTPAAVTSGEYYVALLMGGGSGLGITRGAANQSTNMGLTAGEFRSCLAGSGLTAIPASVNLALSTSPLNPPAWCVGLRSV